MWVRVAHTRQDVRYYDDRTSRVLTDLKSERWAEYLVVWRRGRTGSRLELYENHVSSFFFRELFEPIPERPLDTSIQRFFPGSETSSICNPAPMAWNVFLLLLIHGYELLSYGACCEL